GGAAATFVTGGGGGEEPLLGAADCPGVGGAPACDWPLCGGGSCGLGGEKICPTTNTPHGERGGTTQRNCRPEAGPVFFGVCGRGESLTEAFRPSLPRCGSSGAVPQRKLSFVRVPELQKNFPEPGRNRIFLRRDGSARGASCRATCRAGRRSVRWLRRRIVSRWVRSDRLRQRVRRGRTGSSAAQKELREQPGTALDARSWSFQQLQELCRQSSRRRRRHIGLGVNDDVPSCGYLLAVQANHFANAPANAIAHYRAAESALDAETEAALWQIVRFRENGE